jgi:hypothetical protein
MKGVALTYSKISCIITIVESIYLFISFLNPNLLKGYEHFNILSKAIITCFAFLFFVCYYNIFLLFLVGIFLLLSKSALILGLLNICVCIIFYFVTKYSIGYGL